jgi:hypothetical protein
VPSQEEALSPATLYVGDVAAHSSQQTFNFRTSKAFTLERCVEQINNESKSSKLTYDVGRYVIDQPY